MIVNRIFPEELDGSYFGAWRERQAESLEMVREGFAPVPLLRARYFPEEVLGGAMLDRLGDELFGERAPEELMHTELTQRIGSADGRTVLSIRVPFADRDELELSKVGQELIVRAGARETHDHPPDRAGAAPPGRRAARGGNARDQLQMTARERTGRGRRGRADDAPDDRGRLVGGPPADRRERV